MMARSRTSTHLAFGFGPVLTLSLLLGWTTLRAKAYVLDARFEKPFVSDLTERVLEYWQKAGIQPPAVLHRDLTPLAETPANTSTA